MLKMSYTFFYNSRVCNRSAISTIFRSINELSTAPILETSQLKSNLNIQPTEKPSSNTLFEKPVENFKSKSKIVAAAFASLKENALEETPEITTPHIDQRIANAVSVEQLLSIPEGQGTSRRLALKIVSVLADWSASKKIKLADFENDYRFIKLCKVLTRGNNKYDKYVPSRSDDLSTVLSVTADDEAAKLVESITLPQMIKVMTTLSNKKRRSTLLLRTLAYNISGSPEKMNLKLCADLLYSMSSLNFIDENLLSRVAIDICTELGADVEPEVRKSAVIGSILTSLGLMKYKNPIVLDLLTNWITKYYDTCRSQDVFSLFVTLAILNYMPAEAEKCFEVVSPILTKLEAGKPVNWLDHIWAKTLLNIATREEISDVLSEEFLKSLLKSGTDQNISTTLKILNINAAAECLIDSYTGNKLTTSSLFGNVAVPKRKEKIEMAESIAYSLKSLMHDAKYLRTNIDTGYGFFIDAECVLDDKCRPKELNSDKTDGTRIAILSLDYHDMTRGRVEPTGVNIFARKVLEAKGYKILNVPYTEFTSKTKLVKRVQYLETQLKEVVKNV